MWDSGPYMLLFFFRLKNMPPYREKEVFVMSITKVPTLNEMGGRKAWAWAGWRLFKDACRKRRNPEYDFEKLSEEEKLEDYLKFNEVYEQEEKENK
jgi:hypothetical protein